jgi:predicted  nucleic acid-binding Zn-ribbon protein
MRGILDERDTRYHQRFEAQQEALAAALLAQKEAVLTAMIAAEKAVAKAEAATEKRFESVNEFRGQLADQAATLMSRIEYSSAHANLVQQIDALTARVSLSVTKVEADSIHGGQAERLNDLAARVGKIEGQSAGMNRSWGIVAAVVGFGLTIVGILIVVFR